MKNLFIFQIGNSNPDPWDDAVEMVNLDIKPGLGVTHNNNSVDYKNYVNFMQRLESRFIISPTADPDADFVLQKPYVPDSYSSPFRLKFDEIVEIMDKAPDIFIFATDLAKAGGNYKVAVENAAYYARNQETGDVTDLKTGEILYNPTLIPYFFCFKTPNYPLYYMVFNPNYVQVSGDIDGDYGEHRVAEISGHVGSISKALFSPRFSKNVREIGEHNVFVMGEEFTVEAFQGWFVKRNAPKFFKDIRPKVSTNFDYHWEGTKIVINSKNKDKGFLSLRWNSGTPMDMTFANSKNRFFREYVIDIIKD